MEAERTKGYLAEEDPFQTISQAPFFNIQQQQEYSSQTHYMEQEWHRTQYMRIMERQDQLDSRIERLEDSVSQIATTMHALMSTFSYGGVGSSSRQ